MSIARTLKDLGLELPAEFRSPTGTAYPFVWVKIVGNRAYLAGHLPQARDGSLAPLRGKVGSDLTLAEGQLAARLVALAMLGTLERKLGDLDRVAGWVRVFGMVNAAPGFTDLPQVMNGFSELIRFVFGPDGGSHVRSAVGVAELPFGVPVEIEAEVEIR